MYGAVRSYGESWLGCLSTETSVIGPDRDTRIRSHDTSQGDTKGVFGITRLCLGSARCDDSAEAVPFGAVLPLLTDSRVPSSVDHAAFNGATSRPSAEGADTYGSIAGGTSDCMMPGGGTILLLSLMTGRHPRPLGCGTGTTPSLLRCGPISRGLIFTLNSRCSAT